MSGKYRSSGGEKHHRVSADMRVDQESADMSTDSRSTYRLTVGPHIGRGCQPTEAFITHDPFFSGKDHSLIWSKHFDYSIVILIKDWQTEWICACMIDCFVHGFKIDASEALWFILEREIDCWISISDYKVTELTSFKQGSYRILKIKGISTFTTEGIILKLCNN